MVNKIVSHEQTRESAMHESKSRPFRAVVLEQAISCTLGDREDAYGLPSEALALTAQFVGFYKQAARNKYCPAHDEAIALALLKLARIACGAVGHNDNYVDGAAYFAIAAECQHLYAKPIVNENRLAEVDKKYKAAIESAVGAKADLGMLNHYVPANKKV